MCKTKQLLSNFQTRFPKFRQQLQAEMKNRAAYKKMCKYHLEMFIKTVNIPGSSIRRQCYMIGMLSSTIIRPWLR